MEDKVEEINTEEVSLIETEGPKRRSGSYLKVRLSMKRFPMTSFTRHRLITLKYYYRIYEPELGKFQFHSKRNLQIYFPRRDTILPVSKKPR